MIMASQKVSMAYLSQIKDTFEMGSEVYRGYMNLMRDYQRKRVSLDDLPKRVRELFKGHETLILGFNNFLPVEKNIVLTEDEIAFNFVNKVKMRFDDDRESFDNFLCLLEMYATKKISVIEVYKEVAVLFQNHRDLLMEFRDYLPDTFPGISKKRRFEESVAKQSHPRYDSHKSSSAQACSSSNSDISGLEGIHGQKIAFLEKVKDTCGDDIQQELKRYIELYRLRKVPRSELKNLIDKLLVNNPKLMRRFNKILEESESIGHEKYIASVEGCDVSGENIFAGENRFPQKYVGKSVKDLDFSNCTKFSPSYRELPKDYPVNVSSHRTPLARSVLNDRCICLASESDYECSKGNNKRINSYEEKMFQLEDTRFEIDMFIERFELTFGRAKKLMKAINNNKYGKNPVICLKDHFTDQNIRCIEKLYGDYGVEILELLKSRAARVLPIILRRLVQKWKEWIEFRTNFNNKMKFKA